MKPLGRSDADYQHAAFVALSGYEGELLVEDLELTYLYRRGIEEVLESDASGVPLEHLAAWLDGACSVVRRLKLLHELGQDLLTQDQLGDANDAG